MSKPHLLLAHEYWRAHLKPSDFAIDMTCGNGHDTLYLSQLLPEGLVFGVDLQEMAIQKTKERVGSANNVRYFCQSHAEPLPLPSPPRLIVYNLGYLPGGDKSITTNTESTLKSIEQSLAILSADGAVSITCYPGHEEGEREERAILELVKGLHYSHHQWTERLRHPSLVWIQQS